MGAKFDHFCLFSAYFGVFSPDLLIEYRIFISIGKFEKNHYDEESDHSNKAVRKTPEIESGHKVSEEVK